MADPIVEWDNPWALLAKDNTPKRLSDMMEDVWTTINSGKPACPVLWGGWLLPPVWQKKTTSLLAPPDALLGADEDIYVGSAYRYEATGSCNPNLSCEPETAFPTLHTERSWCQHPQDTSDNPPAWDDHDEPKTLPLVHTIPSNPADISLLNTTIKPAHFDGAKGKFLDQKSLDLIPYLGFSSDHVSYAVNFFYPQQHNGDGNATVDTGNEVIIPIFHHKSHDHFPVTLPCPFLYSIYVPPGTRVDIEYYDLQNYHQSPDPKQDEPNEGTFSFQGGRKGLVVRDFLKYEGVNRFIYLGDFEWINMDWEWRSQGSPREHGYMYSQLQAAWRLQAGVDPANPPKSKHGAQKYPVWVVKSMSLKTDFDPYTSFEQFVARYSCIPKHMPGNADLLTVLSGNDQKMLTQYVPATEPCDSLVRAMCLDAGVVWDATATQNNVCECFKNEQTLQKYWGDLPVAFPVQCFGSCNQHPTAYKTASWVGRPCSETQCLQIMQAVGADIAAAGMQTAVCDNEIYATSPPVTYSVPQDTFSTKVNTTILTPTFYVVMGILGLFFILFVVWLALFIRKRMILKRMGK